MNDTTGPLSDAADETRNAERATAPARTSTTVWGIVVALTGLAVAAIGVGFRLDLQAALIVLLVVAGAAVLVGAAVTARRGGEDRP